MGQWLKEEAVAVGVGLVEGLQDVDDGDTAVEPQFANAGEDNFVEGAVVHEGGGLLDDLFPGGVGHGVGDLLKWGDRGYGRIMRYGRICFGLQEFNAFG